MTDITPHQIVEHNVHNSSRHRGRWVIWLLGFSLLLLMSIILLSLWITGVSLGGGFGARMVSAQYTPRDVVGDMGGMPVTIPRHMAEFVEYEGDPGWGEKRQGPVPERTHASKLTSFGVQFRYPDMATLSSAAMWKDKGSKAHNPNWMSFGVRTGNRYPGDGFLERGLHTAINGLGQYVWDSYEKLPGQEYGLDMYVLKGIDNKTGRPNREVVDVPPGDTFVAKNSNGKIIADIRCSNRPYPAISSCTHTFSMEMNGVQAQIDVNYLRAMLPHWQDIQDKVGSMLLSFKPTQPVAIQRRL